MPHRKKIRDVILDITSAYLPIILTAILALGSWHMARQAPSVEKPAQVLADNMPDFRMDNFSVSRFNQTGDLVAHIQGTHAQHFFNNDVLHIEDLDSYWFSFNNQTTTIARAQKGISQNHNQIIDLKGEAKILITPTKDNSQPTANSPIFIQSPTLRLWPHEQKLHTPQPSTITHKNAHFQSVGLDYEHNTGILTLPSKVHGVFWPQKP